MSNIGLHRFCKERGLRLLCANVGDRNVLELMQKEGMRLGGEQSGHIIFLDYMPTGDGQLAALAAAEHPLAQQKEGERACIRRPAVSRSCSKTSASAPTTKRLHHAVRFLPVSIRAAEEELGENGRVLIRPSGTERSSASWSRPGRSSQAQAVTDRLVQHVENLQKTTDK